MDSLDTTQAIADFAVWLREREADCLYRWAKAVRIELRAALETEAAELHAVRLAFTQRFRAVLPPQELEAMRFRPYPQPMLNARP